MNGPEVQTRSNTNSIATPSNGAETVILTTNLLTFDNPNGEGVYIEGTLYITNGTGTTGVTIRARQDGLTGNQVDTTGVIPQTASTRGAISFSFLDTSNRSVNAQVGQNPASGLADPGIKYVITLQGTATTGAGSAYGTCSVQAANQAT